MIHLSNEDIAAFQILWTKETGQEIPKEVAVEYAQDILALIQLVYEPYFQQK